MRRLCIQHFLHPIQFHKIKCTVLMIQKIVLCKIELTNALLQIEKAFVKTTHENASRKRTKLGFTGVNLFFLLLISNIYCGYPLVPS